MGTLIKPKLKLELSSFDNSIYQVKEKSKNAKFGLDIKFYQKLFVIFLTLCTFLIFPESPHKSEVLCKKFNSKEACIVW